MSGISTATMLSEEDDPANKRVDVRWDFKSTPFRVRFGVKVIDIRLKDLSCGGACGLMEEPVAIGDHIMIEFDDKHVVEARVCWVRRVLVGLKFTSPLTAAFVSRVHDRAADEKARQDKYAAKRPRLR